jgi:Na+-translocating ferredoxin:NAD+ oxidoreductase RnfD subunit
MTAHLYLAWERVIMLILFASTIDVSFLLLGRDRKIYLPFSACTTAIGVVLMMVATQLWIYFAAVAAGLIQKHLLRIGGKHLFNPSNFALVFALLFFYHDAHIVLGQLGDERWLSGIVLLLGAVILYRVRRLLIPLVFILSYLLCQFLLIVQYDPMMLMEDILLRFYSVSFIVFILFMLTDPRTTPSHWAMQSIFAFLVASLSSLLDYYAGYRVQHLFLSLFLLSFLWRIEGLGRWEPREKFLYFALTFLVLGAIIYIEMQPPYYFEMDG